MRLRPGRVFACVTVVPAVALSAWLLVAFPLLLAGQFTPVAGAVLGIPAVVAAVALVPRWVPDPPDEAAGWWPVLATVAVVLAFWVVQTAYHGEVLVVRRDPASYAEFTAWIAQHGSLPIPQHRELIAGDDPALHYDSLAFYEVGDVVWPQFLSGTPLVLSVGYWLAGLKGVFLTTPILGALGVLTFAGVVARLVGARWAPLAALLLAVCLPQQWVSRATYSEPAAQILLLGALALALDALARHTSLRERWGRAHALAVAAGLAFGLGLVVRIDALRDLLPVVVFLGLLLLARRGQAPPMLAGLAVGLGYGFVAGFVLSAPYLDYLSDSLNPLLLISAAVTAGTAVGTAVLWRRGVPRTDRPRWLPTAAAIAVLVVMVGFALRPVLLPEYGHGNGITANFVGQLQELEGLPVDPDRNYEDMSLYWVGWYVGLSTVFFASLGAAVLLRRLLLGREPRWVLPAMVLFWTVATTLARPAITPDHPWASRRLVVLVLPAFVLLAVWFVAWATRRLRAAGPPGGWWLSGALAACAAVVMLAPTAGTARGVMGYRSDVGTLKETRALCAAIPADASVIVVDAIAANYMQLIRGVCGVPTAASSSDTEAVARVVGKIRERGRVPVLAAGDASALSPHISPRAHVEHAFEVRASQDPSTLMHPPEEAWTFHGSVWIARLP